MPFGIDISAIRKRIHDLLKQIERQNDLGADGGRIVTLDQQSVGRLPRIDALQQQAMARATRSRREAHRARLLAALNRLEEGEFGSCEECGDEIPAPRFSHDPTATRCIACASG